jgi:probable DNA metabolism protein
MVLVVYDGSFEGFLSAVFDVYEYKFADVMFSRDPNYQEPVFGTVHKTITDENKMLRVWKGLGQRVSNHTLSKIYQSFLSESKDIDTQLLAFIRYAFSSNKVMETDYSHPAVLAVIQIAKKVQREKHRMEAFIRFQLTRDQLYYAVIDPDFDVLPLIRKHFAERYADQNWLIYDLHRKYGLYYNGNEVTTVTISFAETGAQNINVIVDEKEDLYQKLWQHYFTSVNIAARKNMKLHIQHMPRRYWRFLPEKKPSA